MHDFRRAAWALVVSFGAVTGCGRVVTIGGAYTDDGAGAGGDQGGAGAGGYHGGPDVGGGTPTGGGPAPVQADDIAGVDGDVLKVALGNYTEVCGPSAFDHYPDNVPPCSPSESWQIRLNLPLAELHEHAIFTLAEVGNGWSFAMVTDPTLDPAQYGCAGGGGSYADGTVEILSLTDTTMTLRLTGTDSFFGPDDTLPDGSLKNGDGDYDVSLCGATPAPAELLTSAVAVPSSAVPGNTTLVLANLQNTCSDPHLYGAGCDGEIDTVSIELSPDMQAPGTYPLTDIATFSTKGGGSGDCTLGQGSYWNGSIEILSADDTEIAFTLSGTSQPFISEGNADGTYVASRCP